MNNAALLTLLCVVGARPNFMKIAPIMAALMKNPRSFRPFLVHTGQHYDAAMKDAFFHQLGIPEPDIDLEVGSGTHAVQTAQIMLRFEPVLDEVKPAAVLVVGDVNSTIACGLVAVKKGIPIIHVEAGLRSHDRTMPEEINRILTDQLADLLFITERSARENLLKEGIAENKIFFAGNVMIDSLLNNLKKAAPLRQTLGERIEGSIDSVKSNHYAVLTLHRPSNVDDRAVLQRLLETIQKVSRRLPVIFPIHPRTQKMIREFALSFYLEQPTIYRIPPVGYLEMLGLIRSAKFVLTDSGGLQEETTALGIPCLTLRENTERPITVEQGTNTVVGSDPDKIMACVADIFSTGGKSGRVPEHWDGRAAERIVDTLKQKLSV